MVVLQPAEEMCDFYKLSASPIQFTLQQMRQLLLDAAVGLTAIFRGYYFGVNSLSTHEELHGQEEGRKP